MSAAVKLPEFLRTPIEGVYAVAVSTTPGAPVSDVLGTVRRAFHNPNVWEARNLRNTVVAHRSTRQLAGLALIREES